MKHLLIAAGFCALAFPALAQTKFQAQLSGAQEVPPKQTNGTGTATATLNGNTLDYTVEYNGLSGPATMGHLHGPAAPGANAGVVVPFANPASPIHGTATLNDQQKADLMAGKWYANIHTQQNPGGEIRGQMTPAQ
ncbi:MAG: CHRD domain-containing protein [Acetobacteraceae bacterium]|nr:CHRD domain-containing protein [Acetobacteraceae bacterium]